MSALLAAGRGLYGLIGITVLVSTVSEEEELARNPYSTNLVRYRKSKA